MENRKYPYDRVKHYGEGLRRFVEFGRLRRTLAHAGSEGLKSEQFQIVNRDFETLTRVGGFASLIVGAISGMTAYRLFPFRTKKTTSHRLKVLTISFIAGVSASVLVMQFAGIHIERRLHSGIDFVLKDPLYHQWLNPSLPLPDLLYSTNFEYVPMTSEPFPFEEKNSLKVDEKRNEILQMNQNEIASEKVRKSKMGLKDRLPIRDSENVKNETSQQDVSSERFSQNLILKQPPNSVKYELNNSESHQREYNRPSESADFADESDEIRKTTSSK
jgi:hypothetical protein